MVIMRMRVMVVVVGQGLLCRHPVVRGAKGQWGAFAVQEGMVQDSQILRRCRVTFAPGLHHASHKRARERVVRILIRIKRLLNHDTRRMAGGRGV